MITRMTTFNANLYAMPYVSGYRAITEKGILERLMAKGYRFLSIGPVIGIEPMAEGGRSLRAILPTCCQEVHRWECADSYALSAPEAVTLFHERDNLLFVSDEYFAD